VNKITRADILLLLLVVTLLPFVYRYYWQDTLAGEKALIYVRDKPVKEISLHKNRQISIDGALGKSTLQIENGKIRFIDSPCTTKMCIQKGWHNHSGDFNACLPNGISFEIISTAKNDKPQFDSINF